MSESNVLNPPRTVTGGGGGGQFVTDRPGSRSGDPTDDDRLRLARMVERIGFTLERLVHLEPKLVPEPVAVQLSLNWPEAKQKVNEIVGILRGEIPLLYLPTDLMNDLQRAGLTGPMLRMKETSLYYFLNNIDAHILAYEQKHSAPKGPILTYPEKKGVIETLFGWLKPGFKVMNSILGSLPNIFGAKEIIKEFKDHTEAGYEVGEYLAKQRETE
jgi:hypothetical protein